MAGRRPVLAVAGLTKEADGGRPLNCSPPLRFRFCPRVHAPVQGMNPTVRVPQEFGPQSQVPGSTCHLPGATATAPGPGPFLLSTSIGRVDRLWTSDLILHDFPERQEHQTVNSSGNKYLRFYHRPGTQTHLHCQTHPPGGQGVFALTL